MENLDNVALLLDALDTLIETKGKLRACREEDAEERNLLISMAVFQWQRVIDIRLAIQAAGKG